MELRMRMCKANLIDLDSDKEFESACENCPQRFTCEDQKDQWAEIDEDVKCGMGYEMCELCPDKKECPNPNHKPQYNNCETTTLK